MAKRKKDISKNTSKQNVILQREIFAEMEKMKAEIAVHFDIVKTIIIKNKEP